ncbi:hypothetical protein NEAUS03_0645 [Nematocida ausubeli]|nr:hypothetical protein NEAUS03_0645 [Nematocida ausubeli]
MKIRFSVIWIKAVILIGVLLVKMHRADISLPEIETTLQFEITTDSSQVVINPDGPLNFLRGLIYQKMECMYNKRFFAPQIDTEYSLEENSNKTNNYDIYKYNRNEQMDKAYEALPENKMDVYAEKYHTHLIELFPSPTGDITIETRGNQSFIQFLRAETTKEHSLQILAMLLLFSEGVSIPIDVNNTVLKVYEKDKKDEIYFEVPMEIPWLRLNTKEERVETFKQKKVKQMIKFFQEYATDLEVLNLMKDKCSQEEVMSGKFLNSPKFLIQSYIFGFIDTAERATEFIQTVHTMTEKYAPKTETPSKDDCVYDRLFKPTSTTTELVKGTDPMVLMKNTQEIINMYKSFPFANKTELPAYKSVPWRDPITKEFSTNHIEDYSNCVECMILSLFCCLAYDPSDFKYKTDHMGNVSPSLKEFFTPKKDEIFDTKKVEFQKRWSTVVACLDEPSIAYCRKRNELDCGLINMLLVIAEIVNVPIEKKKKILELSESLKEKMGELDYKLCDSIEEYTKEILKRLSKIEKVQVQFSELKSDKYKNGRYDISGKITITFEHNNIKNTILLIISEDHSTIDIKPTVMKLKDKRMRKLNEVAASCKNKVTFVESLFAAYIEYEIRKIDTPEKNSEFLKEQVRKTIKSDFKDINRLLLIKKISDLEHKKNLVTCSIVYSMDKNLLPDHPIIRFTSNVVGSTELDNRVIQFCMLPPIILVGEHDENGNNLNYQKIQLFEESYKITMGYIMGQYLVKYVLECDISIFIEWIKFCINNFDPHYEQGIYELLDTKVTKAIYEYIFRDGDMKYANAVDEAIEQCYPEKKEVILNNLHNIWFMYLIREKNLNVELTKKNFDAIRIPSYISSSFVYCNMQHVIENFRKMKEHLCSNEGSISKFNKLMQISQIA